MAERQVRKDHSRARETHPPPITREQFENTPEFRKFTEGMKKLLEVPKAELDAMVAAAKQSSPRAGNPRAPGRKKSR
jgi:hypothetical protein